MPVSKAKEIETSSERLNSNWDKGAAFFPSPKMLERSRQGSIYTTISPPAGLWSDRRRQYLFSQSSFAASRQAATRDASIQGGSKVPHSGSENASAAI